MLQVERSSSRLQSPDKPADEGATRSADAAGEESAGETDTEGEIHFAQDEKQALINETDDSRV